MSPTRAHTSQASLRTPIQQGIHGCGAAPAHRQTSTLGAILHFDRKLRRYRPSFTYAADSPDGGLG
ncbi:MAG TPA: hypothetical protein PKW66_26070, partial [Polyangiaceae bacterium]|nr:hypothetical protein [Polyangiaceae bacterium]